ncbi:hypothetical protein ON010_g2783 [Phytophthora cinnamomi]|nr:hypothetical protein ON010_g2783 [Phytophthora cinnamomi]
MLLDQDSTREAASLLDRETTLLTASCSSSYKAMLLRGFSNGQQSPAVVENGQKQQLVAAVGNSLNEALHKRARRQECVVKAGRAARLLSLVEVLELPIPVCVSRTQDAAVRVVDDVGIGRVRPVGVVVSLKRDQRRARERLRGRRQVGGAAPRSSIARSETVQDCDAPDARDLVVVVVGDDLHVVHPGRVEHDLALHQRRVGHVLVPGALRRGRRRGRAAPRRRDEDVRLLRRHLPSEVVVLVDSEVRHVVVGGDGHRHVALVDLAQPDAAGLVVQIARQPRLPVADRIGVVVRSELELRRRDILRVVVVELPQCPGDTHKAGGGPGHEQCSERPHVCE